VYGTVRTVVWEDGGREPASYPIMRLKPEGQTGMTRLFSLFAAISLCVLLNHNAMGQQLSELDKARAIAVKVNNVLTDYIRVHDDVFTVSTRRIIPIPGVFEAIDFKSHFSRLRKQRQTLASVDGEISTWLRQGVRDVKVRTFVLRLRDYNQALSKTLAHFEAISQNLYKKSQDPTHYSWDTYNKDLDAYQQSIDEYRRLGVALNEAYQGLAE
jgi:hypothetical protein